MPLKMSQFVVVFVVPFFLTMITVSEAARRKRSDDFPLTGVVTQLSQHVTTLDAEIKALNAEMTAVKARTAALDKAVAFHTWGTHNPVRATANGLIVLDHVVTNVGNAYNPLTGIFTAPLAGLYDFHASIMTPQLDNFTHAGLFVDSSLMALALSDSRHDYYAQTNINAVVHVNSGQNVFLRNVDTFDSSYYVSIASPYTTFSGFLIKAD